MNSSGDGHSGYSSGLGGGDGPLDMVIGYLQNMGFSFSYSNGSYSYHNNNNNSSSNSNNDPCKRDSNQNIIAERTQAPAFQYNTYGIAMTMEEFELTLKDNTTKKAYKVTSVVDPVTGLPRNATEAEKANCLGFALTDGDYWVLDNPSTLIKDEGLITRSDIVGWYGYEACDKSEASLVVVYDGNNAIHAGIVNSDGTYDAKGGVREIVRGLGSEAEFLKPYGDNGPSYAEGDVLYYKKKD